MGKIVNVRVPEELHERVVARAREEGVTISSVLRRALEGFVATGRIEPTGYAPDPPPRPPKPSAGEARGEPRTSEARGESAPTAPDVFSPVDDPFPEPPEVKPKAREWEPRDFSKAAQTRRRKTQSR